MPNMADTSEDGPEELVRSGQPAFSESLQAEGSSVFQDQTPMHQPATPRRSPRPDTTITEGGSTTIDADRTGDPKPGPSTQIEDAAPAPPPPSSIREDDGFGADIGTEGFDEGAGLFEGSAKNSTH